jgi:hypothetical protein
MKRCMGGVGRKKLNFSKKFNFWLRRSPFHLFNTGAGNR